MDDRLDALRDEAESAGVLLDGSVDDLDRLEQLFDTLAESATAERRTGLIITLGRHLGDVMRQCFGGRWQLPLDDAKDVHFNTPVIVGHAAQTELTFSPLMTMRAHALRKRPGLVRRAVMSQVQPEPPLDLSDLMAQERKPRGR